MITVNKPHYWRDLQTATAQILSECGMKAEVEKNISTARANVSVDVFAQEEIDGIKNVIICECKNWNRPVEQEKINAVRTVVQDYGANTGYIISKSGFYPGAYSSTDFTNIQLLDWLEFQNLFEARWLKRHFIPTVTERLDPIVTYVEPGEPNWARGLPSEFQEEVAVLKLKYSGLAILAMLTSEYGIMAGETIPKLPLSEHWTPKLVKMLPPKIVNALAYRELLDAMIQMSENGVSEFLRIKKQLC